MRNRIGVLGCVLASFFFCGCAFGEVAATENLRFFQIFSGFGLRTDERTSVVFFEDASLLADLCFAPPMGALETRFSKHREEMVDFAVPGYDNIVLPRDANGESEYVFALLAGEWKSGAEISIARILRSGDELVVRGIERKGRNSGGNDLVPWVFVMMEKSGLKAKKAVFQTLAEEISEAGNIEAPIVVKRN